MCIRDSTEALSRSRRGRFRLRAMASKLSSMPFLTDTNNPVGYCVQGSIEFANNSRRLIQRCTKPDAKEFKKIA
eukprot:10075663-Alexandrium_andersonii.AAC.1